MYLRSQWIITIRVLWVKQLQLKVLLLFPYFKVELLVLGGLNQEPLMSHIWNEEGKVLSNFMLIHNNKCDSGSRYFTAAGRNGRPGNQIWALKSCSSLWKVEEPCCFLHTEWILFHRNYSWFLFVFQLLFFFFIKWHKWNEKVHLPRAKYFATCYAFCQLVKIFSILWYKALRWLWGGGEFSSVRIFWMIVKHFCNFLYHF